jgi:hypothetical protein
MLFTHTSTTFFGFYPLENFTNFSRQGGMLSFALHAKKYVEV